MFPIHLNLGFRIFYFYEGFYFLLAIAVACLVGGWRLKRAGLDVDAFIDSLPWILLGAILGARIFHFVFWDWNAFRTDPMRFFRIWGHLRNLTASQLTSHAFERGRLSELKLGHVGHSMTPMFLNAISAILAET